MVVVGGVKIGFSNTYEKVGGVKRRRRRGGIHRRWKSWVKWAAAGS